jgi:hypothetical protein
VRATLQATYHLMLRSLRETIRQPAVEVGNLFIPASSSSGLGMTTDIERGYFDKLLLTPAPRRTQCA